MGKESPAKVEETKEAKEGEETMVAKLKAAVMEKDPRWLAFTAVTLLLSVVSVFKLVFFLLHMVFWVVLAWRVWLGIALIIMGIVRHVVAPVACVLGNAWMFREQIVDVAVDKLKEKKCVLKKLKIDGKVANKQCEVCVSNFGLRPEGDPEDIVSLDNLRLTAKLAKTPKQQLTAVDLEVVLEKLDVNLITYDMKFKDTNLNRLLTELAGEEEEPGTPPPPDKEEQPQQAPAAAPGGESRFGLVCRIKKSAIEVKAAGALGVRPIVPAIVLDDETVDIKVFQSKVSLIKWLNGIVLRTIANSSLDLVSGAFNSAGGLATGVAGKAFDGVDKIAGYVPGGSIVKGGTGAARDVLGGVVGGGGKVVGGVAQGGKDIMKGLTSGSISGVASGFKNAGKSVGGGVVGGVASVGGGVVNAGKSVGGGVVAAGAGAKSTVFGKGHEGSSHEESEDHRDEEDHPPQEAAKKRKTFKMFSRKKNSGADTSSPAAPPSS